MAKPQTKKSLGQHWLQDAASLAAICEAADLGPSDVVLEIGPGLGALTEFLLARAGRVVAVELDKNLATNLLKNLRQLEEPGEFRAAASLEVVNQDILQFDYGRLPPGYKVVANIPYYLTSNLVRGLSEAVNPPSLAVLLVQKEVAERLAAAPGKLSILGVTAQFYWQVSLGGVVRAELFSPPPKVDSQVVVLRRRPEPLFAEVDPKNYFKLVKAGFSQKRKTLVNSLSGGLAIPKDQAKTMLAAAGIPQTARAQTLALTDWKKLLDQLQKSQAKR